MFLSNVEKTAQRQTGDRERGLGGESSKCQVVLIPVKAEGGGGIG